MNSLLTLFKKTEMEVKILQWKKDYLRNKVDYQISALWQEIGQHPLDILFLNLASLYDLANIKDKKTIERVFSKNSHRLWQLIIFVRRLAKLIISEKDEHLVKQGLMISVIEGAQFDFRDSIVSLLILKYAAARANIPIDSMLEELIDMPIPQRLKEVFINVRDHAKADIIYTIKKSGPSEWTKDL